MGFGLADPVPLHTCDRETHIVVSLHSPSGIGVRAYHCHFETGLV